MHSLWSALPSSQKGGFKASAEALIEPVKAALRTDDIVMIKGSNGIGTHKIVAALRESFASDADE
jgi:UDP-N-acetylmuramoyl-tripeptide--D-alanyl-D-alanine ligase